MTSFILTTFNDGDNALKMYESLLASLPVNSSHKLVIVDGGSSEEELKKIRQIGSVFGTYPHLSDALNAGYYISMGFQPDGSNFDTNIAPASENMIWIHTDMRFPQYNWANKLIDIHKDCSDLVVKLCPGTHNIDGSVVSMQKGEILREGNSCPHLMNAKFLYEFYDKWGYIFNNKYVNIGGFEDHDQWFRFKQMGYIMAICSLVCVYHKGMGTREMRDTNPDQWANRNTFHSIWGPDSYQPECTMDLSEMNAELNTKYSNLKEEVEKIVTTVPDPWKKSCN